MTSSGGGDGAGWIAGRRSTVRREHGKLWEDVLGAISKLNGRLNAGISHIDGNIHGRQSISEEASGKPLANARCHFKREGWARNI